MDWLFWIGILGLLVSLAFLARGISRARGFEKSSESQKDENTGSTAGNGTVSSPLEDCGEKIHGQNPLPLLYKTLSAGIHDTGDEYGLALARSVRIVLTELAEWIGQALKDERKLQAAVARLAGKKPAATSEKKPAPQDASRSFYL
ncbi:MAG: hypothetical protein HYZ72_10210 [Deltaproteobacteria bacterium]|nr:hypothetical protein [Deltaproteobacteria bacterium]